MNSSSRRNFFKKVGTLTGAVLVTPQILTSIVNAEEQRRPKKGGAADAGPELTMVEPGKGIAAGINYQTKHEDVKDKALKTDRNGVAFDKQFCNGCMLFEAAGKKNGVEVGKCKLFVNQLVVSKGWCATWQKKQG
jgi:hypothetical protein